MDPEQPRAKSWVVGLLVMAVGALGSAIAVRDFFPSDQPYYTSWSPKRRVEPELRLLAFGGVFTLGLATVVNGCRSR